MDGLDISSLISNITNRNIYLDFRCRSAFKLLEINKQTKIIQPGHVVVDCGAAPGSWMQVAVTESNANGAIKNKPKGFIIGIDLQHIYPIEVRAFLTPSLPSATPIRYIKIYSIYSREPKPLAMPISRYQQHRNAL